MDNPSQNFCKCQQEIIDHATLLHLFPILWVFTSSGPSFLPGKYLYHSLRNAIVCQAYFQKRATMLFGDYSCCLPALHLLYTICVFHNKHSTILFLSASVCIQYMQWYSSRGYKPPLSVKVPHPLKGQRKVQGQLREHSKALPFFQDVLWNVHANVPKLGEPNLPSPQKLTWVVNFPKSLKTYRWHILECCWRFGLNLTGFFGQPSVFHGVSLQCAPTHYRPEELHPHRNHLLSGALQLSLPGSAQFFLLRRLDSALRFAKWFLSELLPHQSQLSKTPLMQRSEPVRKGASPN